MACKFCELLEKSVEGVTACEIDPDSKEYYEGVRMRMALLAEALPHVIQKVVEDMDKEEQAPTKDGSRIITLGNQNSTGDIK